MANVNATASGIGLPAVLFLIFLVLKLTHNIDWSWWWVTAPLWIPWSLFLVVLVLVLWIVFRE